VAGRLSDFFRLWWGLLYWNTRKSWFRLRRGRSVCPCQNPSDSGRAFETQCDASLAWARPARFRHVCPLLVATKDGWRCSADTADVRPFWGRAGLLYGGGLLAVYLAGVVAVFAFLRTVGFPVSIVHLTLPPLWHRVTETRSWFFLTRANEAFAANKPAEGLLYLANAYQFDPGNYTAGIMLAKNLQAGHPARSDRVFEQLLRDHPDKRSATAQDWFRALLARGSFERINVLAQDELLRGPLHAGVWLRALLVSTRQTADDAPLRAVLGHPAPHLRTWQPVIELELLLRAGRTAEARTRLAAGLPADAPPFLIFHHIDATIRLRQPHQAIDQLGRWQDRLDGEATAHLVLSALAVHGSRTRVQRFAALLDATPTPPVVTTLCAHLIRYPDDELFQRLWQRLAQIPLPLNTDTAGAWFSLMCAAGAVGDFARLGELTERLKNASSTPFLALAVVEAFFRGQTAERRINSFLPILPLPIDVTYALIERYSPPLVAPSPSPAGRRP